MAKEELIARIKKLKQEKKAIILVHNYQIPEVQEVADYLGDSLGLSRQAAESEAEVIVFCGVHFMAETASILCPDKVVLIPEVEAGCPMANMITAQQLRELKKEHPEAVVVCYVNTTAEVKAESDICCTSANVVKIIDSIEVNRPIIFIPDKYLGLYAANQVKRELILWEGYCPTHVKIVAEHIEQAKATHPDAEVIVHPECTPEVIAKADKVLSTSGMCKYAKGTKSRRLIIGTETGILYRLRKENPDKEFYPLTDAAICPNMKLNSLEKVLWALEEMKHEVKVTEDIRIKAKQTVDKMLTVGRQE